MAFQSTRPSRASTILSVTDISRSTFQSTRPSWASTKGSQETQASLFISIHKALAGLDVYFVGLGTSCGISIHKALAGLDDYPLTDPRDIYISIHKALAGLDESNAFRIYLLSYFNPQGPRGPRLFKLHSTQSAFVFQSTRPSRASTVELLRHGHMSKISIHKALAGLDDIEDSRIVYTGYISIHKALAGLDFYVPKESLVFAYFNPQGPRGPRRIKECGIEREQIFQSTRPSRASTTQNLHK